MRKRKDAQWVYFNEDRRQVIEDVRQAEREVALALWRFHDALGEDHVDYAIYSLEAAEKKLDMLLRKAKGLWSITPREEESRGKIG
ncbi:DUF2508 domain-containing protein [Cohnella pontilimi]|uniref:DUF2508 domain-containing protein n=1 Tax=Cohnella pontilimi TaxID=2564100 RepID=A0A4U0F369_9BACL|nr:DUF2508 domain-containing protein [Cohnella pontilimi]TJY38991.1 DUF2508 domain-containing protein [Cohnella pontilimi]